MGSTVAAVANTAGNVLSNFGMANIGRAQEGAAAEQQQNAVNAANSPEQLAQLSKANELNLEDLRNRQAIINSVNPSLIELGNATLKMLRGESDSPLMSTYNTSSANARTELENKLRAQYGSGYLSTSAAQNALNNFDLNNANQKQTLNYTTAMNNLNLLNPYAQQGLQTNLNSMLNIGNGYGNNASRVSNAYMGTGQNMVSTAGADNLQQIALGKTLSGGSGTLASIFGGAGKIPGNSAGTSYLNTSNIA